MDKGNLNIRYLTLTNDLVNSQKNQYQIPADTKDMFISKFENR